MGELKLLNDQQTITSLEVAEMVGRRHDHVIRDIKAVISHLDNAPNFGVVDYFTESAYRDGKGETRICYLLTKKGCELFATRMTGAKGTQFAVKYIERFNEMEIELKQQTLPSYMIEDPIHRAKRWIKEQEEKQQLAIDNEMYQQQIKENEPYTHFGKIVSISDGAINVGAFSKIIYEKHGINLGRNKLMDWLRDNGYLIKQRGAERNLPKQRYIEQGWFRVRTNVVARTEGDIQTGTTLITGKGQVALTEILLNEFKQLG